MLRLNNALVISFVVLSLGINQISFADTRAELSEILANVKAFDAEFMQITEDKYGEVVSVSEGNLVVSTQGRFRIETTSPFNQQLVSNGQDFYNYDVELEQVIIRPLVKDVSQVPILMLGADDDSFLQDYEVELTNRLYRLRPLENGVFEYLSLGFSEGNIPETIGFKDSLGQTTEIRFNHGRLNQSIEAKTFEFSVPDGVDLVDDR